MNLLGSSISVLGFFSLSLVLWFGSSSLNNESSGTPKVLEVDSMSYKVELGRQLFYDQLLSRDSSVSCATCHRQELAFTDGHPKSIGIRNQILSRNSPTLTNVLNRPFLLLDGVNPNLEAQIMAPIQAHDEFDFHITLIVTRLKRNPDYVKLAELGFGTEIDHRVVFKSIASFERTLISDDSPYDRYMKGDKKALSKSQKRGKRLFFDKLYCSKCHTGNDLTNDAITNNGLYVNYADSGRMRLTENEKDRALFKVPTLRNIEVTGPYMHDGSLATLEEVIAHYESGGKENKGKGEVIKPFKISSKERIDLINFLKSLTDQTFLTNPSYRLDN
jgi:cytochrome c peroxidase